MSIVLPSGELAPSNSEPGRWAPTAYAIGADYLYPGEPTEVTSMPYAYLLGALDTASRDGDPSIIQPLLAPGSESVDGMREEFARRGLELGPLRTLPQLYSVALGVGDLLVGRKKWSYRLFNLRQLEILDHASDGYKNNEIAALMEITADEYQGALTRMGRQANCKPGLLRLMRRATESQARTAAFALPPHAPIELTPYKQKVIVNRSQGLGNRDIAAREQHSPLYQDKVASEIIHLFGARNFNEVITKAVLMGIIPLEPREPKGRPLSDQQVRALTLAAQGHSLPEIGTIMGVKGAVDTYMMRVLEKLGAKSIDQAVLRAFEDGTFVAIPPAQ